MRRSLPAAFMAVTGCSGAIVLGTTGPPPAHDAGSSADTGSESESASTQDAAIADGPPADEGGTCVPIPCAAVCATCGTVSDGCGHSSDCGTCVSPEVCGGGGPNVCGVGCIPKVTCASAGASCGPIRDDCGQTVDCGACSPPEICGGGGTSNACGVPGKSDAGASDGCTPRSCAGHKDTCGVVDDGCGGTIDCGTCGGGLVCLGCDPGMTCSAPPGTGFCTPQTCKSLGFTCGCSGDGCGGSLYCGFCSGGQLCIDGACSCPLVCGGSCVDPNTDASHCGSCGTSCASGETCEAGLCLTVLVSGLQNAGAIAVDGSTVYWTDESGCWNGHGSGNTTGRVMRVSSGGGTPVTLAWGQASPQWSIAVDGASVFWTNFDSGGGQTMRLPKGGGTSVTLASSGTGNPWGISVDATSVYWAIRDQNAVVSVPIGGGAVSTLAAMQPLPGSTAVDATFLYWTTFGTDGMGGSGTVMKVPKSGGTPVTLVSGQSPGSVAVDATSVYWLSGGVQKVPLSGGTPSTLATGGTDYGSGGIALDGAYVYWGNGQDMMKVPKSGGASVTLATGQPVVGGVAVDAKSVYWTTGDAVKKTLKTR